MVYLDITEKEFRRKERVLKSYLLIAVELIWLNTHNLFNIFILIALEPHFVIEKLLLNSKRKSILTTFVNWLLYFHSYSLFDFYMNLITLKIFFALLKSMISRQKSNMKYIVIIFQMQERQKTMTHVERSNTRIATK